MKQGMAVSSDIALDTTQVFFLTTDRLRSLCSRSVKRPINLLAMRWCLASCTECLWQTTVGPKSKIAFRTILPYRLIESVTPAVHSTPVG